MLTDGEGYRILDKCIDNNVLAYDSYARLGVCTKFLIYTMKRLAPLITHIIMPKEVFVEFLPMDWTSTESTLTCFGIKLEFDERLKSGRIDYINNRSQDCGVWLDYYVKRSASLATGDEYLLVGYQHTDEFIKTLTKENVVIGSC